MKAKHEWFCKIVASFIMGVIGYFSMGFAGLVFRTPADVIVRGSLLVALLWGGLWFIIFTLFGILGK